MVCAVTAGLELYRAESERDREELFRFRYSVYVEEMGRYQCTADHVGHRLVESEMAVSERLMVASHLRGSNVTSKLRELGNQDVEAAGVRLVFGHCEPHLLSLYLTTGARTYAERNVNSAEAGYLTPLLFVLGAPPATA